MNFEWDEKKAASNLQKHRVDFNDAIAVFMDIQAIHIVDRSMNYNEERFVSIGMADGIVYYVAFTETDDVVRIISARRASRLEQREYDRNRRG